MAPLTSLLVLSAVTSAAAFAPQSSIPTSSALNENFGLDFAEDQTDNTPAIILGEANLKQWVGEINPNSFLNRQVSTVISYVLDVRMELSTQMKRCQKSTRTCQYNTNFKFQSKCNNITTVQCCRTCTRTRSPRIDC